MTIHSIFAVYFLGIPGYIQTTMGVYPWIYNSAPREESILLALLLLNIYTIVFFFGYCLSVGRLKENITRARNPSALRLLWLSLGGATLAYVLVQKVGLSAFFQGRNTVGDIIYDESNNISMLYATAKFAAFALLVLVVLDYRRALQGKKIEKYGILLAVAAASTINIVVNSPLSSPRFHFLSMTLTLMIVLGVTNKKSFGWWFFTLSPFFLYIIFPSLKTLGESNGQADTAMLEYLTTGVDFDAFLQLVNIVNFVASNPYSMGENLLGGIAFFVPREIWTEKPVHLGALSSEFAGYAYNNLSAPWPGELYYILGWPSLITGALFSGVLCRTIDRVLSRAGRGQSLLSVGLLSMVSGFLFIILRGAFGAVFPPIALSLSVYSIAYLLSQKTRVRAGG